MTYEELRRLMNEDIARACGVPREFFGFDVGHEPSWSTVAKVYTDARGRVLFVDELAAPVFRGGHRGGGKSRIVIDPKPLDLVLVDGVWQVRV